MNAHSLVCGKFLLSFSLFFCKKRERKKEAKKEREKNFNKLM